MSQTILKGEMTIGVGKYLLGAARAEPSHFEKWDGLHVNFAVRAVPRFAKF